MKKQYMVALGAAMLLGVCVTAADAGSVLRINSDSRAFAVAAEPQAINYYFQTIGTSNSYVIDVKIDGFLFCNHAASAGTSATPMTLVARHAGWTIGGSAGSVAPVSGIDSISYNGRALQLMADSNTQCFSANALGLGAANVHSVFANGFDDYNLNSANNVSSVYVVPYHLPVNSDDRFRYKVIVDLAVATAQGQYQPMSLPSTDFYLNEGYDSALFSSCNIVPGQSVAGVGLHVFYRACQVQPGTDMQQISTTNPVVAAALFTGNGTAEATFGDNLAFGYW